MKIAIIDLGWCSINPYSPLEKALGGSETWLIQIGEEFAKQGNRVHEFFNFTEPLVEQCKVNENLYYFSSANTFQVLQQNHYDFVILSRFTVKNGVNFIDFIKQNKIANHVYVQMHDLSLIGVNGAITTPGEAEEYSLNDDFLTIVTLNQWHKENTQLQYHTASERIICAPNGIDISLFCKNKVKKDHRILWSSCPERGLDILVNDIYPLVKEQVPDFGIDVASYQDVSKYHFEDKDVHILGRLNKEQLYAEQSKHKVWFYPCTFAETFCITMLENIMNGAQVVSPLQFGTSAVLEPFYEQLKTGTDFSNENTRQETLQACADKIISILKDENKKENDKLYENIRKYIREKYNWTTSVNIYVNDYKSKNYVSKSKEKEVLFLSMCCHEPFFLDELQVVKETWAAPIISGEVPHAHWYAFMSCDKEHPNECIDMNNNIVYVNVPDDLSHTYHKMERAYQLLHDFLNFDILIRTNTSMYLNVKLLMQKANELTDEQIAADWLNYYHIFQDGSKHFQYVIFCGNCYMMYKTLADKIFYSNFDKSTLIPSDYDDVVTSKILYTLGIPYQMVHLNENPDTFNTCYRYKVCTEEDKIEKFKSIEIKNTYTDDPNLVNYHPTIQVRCLYEKEERRTKGHELEHMRELHQAYIRYNQCKSLKFLFLSMSCNDKDFVLKEDVVKDTWAKPLIQGKYSDANWFAYRACNDEHPNECIVDHTIYVNCPDDLAHTYSKTKRALQFLKENGYTWQHLVRTNTSTYWNVEKVINSEWKQDTIYSVYGWNVPESDNNFPCPSGWAMILPSSLSDAICNEDFNESFGKYREGVEKQYGSIKDFVGLGYSCLFDDMLIGCLVWCIKDKVSYKYSDLGVFHYKCLVPYGLLNNIHGKEIENYERIFGKPNQNTDDPREINNHFMIQCRCWGTNPVVRYFELEHMYDLEKCIQRKK